MKKGAEERAARSSWGGNAAILGVLLVSLYFFFHVITVRRFLSGDEGFYLYAIKAVLEGKHVYLDFFYPQMPLLPYFYALPMKALGGVTWDNGRMLASLLSALCGLCIFGLVLAETGRRGVALLGVALFALTDLSFGFFPIVKPYSLSAFLLLASLLCIRLTGPYAKAGVFLAGLLFALGVEARLYVIVVAPFLLWTLGRNAPVRWAMFRCFFAGAVTGALPAALLFAYGPETFLFNNLGYHSLRNNEGLITCFPQKLRALRQLLGYGGTNGEISPQFFMLAVATALHAGRAIFERRPMSICGPIGLALLVTSLLPTPTYLQYNALVVPFWAVTSACFVAESIHEKRPFWRSAATAASVVLCLAYAQIFPSEFRRFTESGLRLAGAYGKQSDVSWRLEGAREIGRLINTLTSPGAAVASSWPGYLVDSHARSWPGLENHFGISVADEFNVHKQEQYNLDVVSTMSHAFKRHEVSLLVSGYHDRPDFFLKGQRITLRQLARKYSYVRVAKLGRAVVYAPPNLSSGGK